MTRIRVVGGTLLLVLSAVSLVASQTTGVISGNGTANFLPKFTGTTTIGNSIVYQNAAGNVGIGTTTPAQGMVLDVNGPVLGESTAWFQGDVSSGGTFSILGNVFLIGSTSFSNVLLGFAGNTTMTGCCNTASGAVALENNTTGYENTGDGVAALYHNTTGSQNTGSGRSALDFNTTGSQNTAVGFGSGSTLNFGTNITGSNNTFLGVGSSISTGTLHNATVIGSNAVVSASNSLVLGSINGVNGATANTKVGIGTTAPSNVFTIGQGHGHAIADGWDTYSSRRWKTNIQTAHGALAKVEQLRGVYYDLKDNGKHELGLIAEEVGAVVPEVVSWDKNGKDAQGVDYSRLTALIIEATKEQQALIGKQQEQIRQQQAQIARLSTKVKAIQAALHRNAQAGDVQRVEAHATLVQR